MPINPNTDFVAGAVLTASQMNRLPRGIVAQASATTNLAFAATETLSITASTFTALANRYYRITYFEPDLPAVQNSNQVIARLRLTNTTGTQLASSVIQNADSNAGSRIPQTVTYLGTFAAGSVIIVGTLISPGLSVSATRTSTSPAIIIVEDLGPA